MALTILSFYVSPIKLSRSHRPTVDFEIKPDYLARQQLKNSDNLVT